jgi:hypothetical protein
MHRKTQAIRTTLNAQMKIETKMLYTLLCRAIAAMCLAATLTVLPSATAQSATAAELSPLALISSAGAFADVSTASPFTMAPPEEVASASVSSSIELPEDPSALPDATSDGGFQNESASRGPGAARPVAKMYIKYVPAGWSAQRLSDHQKITLGLRDTYSPFNFAAMIASAGYEQVFNGEPNYGVDRGAFGQRLGAAAIRETTQGIFTDAVFAPLLHEDPRYYVEGSQYSFIHRVVYAATRPLITRTDNGSSSVNGALLLGYAASSALTYTYYPAIDQNFHDTASTFGGALGGAALGFLVSEFSSDIWTMLHLQKKQ